MTKTKIKVIQLPTYGEKEIEGDWSIEDTFTIKHQRSGEATPYAVLEEK